MGTIDISLLSSMTSIVVFLIFFIGGWGVLTLVDPFKEKGRSFYGILAFLLAIVMILTPAAVKVMTSATPWLIILGMVAFFFIFFAKMFGVGDSAIAAQFGRQPVWWLVTFVIIIMLFSLGSAFGPSLLPATAGENANSPQPTMDANGTVVMPSGGAVAPGAAGTTASTDFNSNLVLTIFNPKILGVLFLFLLGTLTILLMNMGS